MDIDFAHLLPEALDASAKDCACLSFPQDAWMRPPSQSRQPRDYETDNGTVCVFSACVCVCAW